MSADPLADVLWAAIEGHTAVADVGAWSDVGHERAAAIAADLYERCGVAGDLAGVAAWKMGAQDEPTRTRLGLAGPLVAPVLPAGLRTDVQEVHLRLADLVAPKLEAEVGVVVEDGRPRPVPCVEVADCRFPQWQVPPACAVADLALQGSMVFGTGVEPTPDVSVTVRHDGVVVGEGGAHWEDVLGKLSILPAGLGSRFRVATGSITAMFPAEAGTWDFDFGATGRLVLHLT